MEYYLSSEWLFSICLLWAGWSGVCWLNVLFYERRLRKAKKNDCSPSDTFSPFVVVIESVKGVPGDYEDHIGQVLRQDYPAYRVVFVVESVDDPARHFLIKKFGISETVNHSIRTDSSENQVLGLSSSPGLRSVDIHVAGDAADTGQKVHNLLHVVKHLEDTDDVLAFLDADTLIGRDWLVQLVHPLRDPEIGVATGYRWLVPGDKSLASSMASVINASIATLLGPSWRNNAWAGSMAITKKNFMDAQLAAYWNGSLNDDFQLSWVMIKKLGQRIHFVNTLAVINEVRYSWATLLEFGRRQYLQGRVYRLELWFVGAVVTYIYLSGWAFSILALLSGKFWAILFMGAVCVFDQLRATSRQAIVRQLFDDSIVQKLRLAFRLERWATPFWFAVHAVIIWSAFLGRELTWAGVRYRLAGRQQTEILFRD